jgi:membrane protein YdbS with pleckstrin-like domain
MSESARSENVQPTASMGADVRPPKDNETESVYYEGSPLVRGSLGSLFFFGLLGILLIAAPFIYHYVFDQPWPPMLATAAIIVAGLLALVIPIIWARTIRYRISNFRIDYERGLLGKTIDTMELWHVDDIKFHQSFMERILGVGTVTIMSDDQTTPSLPLRGLPNPRTIFDALKNRVIAIKRTRGVIKMDSGA